MNAPQYTSCVDRRDYEDPGFTVEIIAAAAGLVYAIPTAGLSLIISLAAAMSALLKVCEYILHGKLVCLGGDRCAIGRIAAFETVAEKEGLDKLDNDFSINILLAPHSLAIFAQGGDQQRNYNIVANDGFQGDLIQEQTDMPLPRESISTSWHSSRYRPTFTTFPDRTQITFNPFLGSRGSPYDVPILHCEIEGERAHAVCATLEAISGLGIPGLCRFKPFGIPIGRWICTIIATLLAPIILAALVIAWFAGSDDNRDFDGAGDRQRGDCVVIHGRWAYDAGHQGWNEIHAVKSLQLVSGGEACNWETFQESRKRWCDRIEEVPPVDPTGRRPAELTPIQEQTYDAQLRPENRWYFHPLVDGCEPVKQPPVVK